METQTVTIDGVEYAPTVKMDTEERVLIRSRDSGVHFGTLAERKGDEVTLTNSRRISYWVGAASLSEMATHGVTKPEDCKFTVRVPQITILGVCEITQCTEKASISIEGVKEWKRS